MKHKAYFLIKLIKLSLLLFSVNLTSQNSIEKRLDRVIKPFVTYQVFSGSVLVSKNGETLYQKGFGLADREWLIDNTAQTKYGIGSLSKTITATLLMKLVQQKKLGLSDRLEKFFPDWPNQVARDITIRQLLTHTSGIPNYFAIPGWTQGHFNRQISSKAFLEVIAKLELSFKPGTQYLYSNSGYYLLCKIIEKITAKSFYQNLNDEIFSPLNMKNTGPNFQEKLVVNRAHGYRWHETKGLKNQPYINMSLFQGAGDLYSTTEDLLKFSEAFNSNVILNKHSRSAMFAPENSYGWNIGNRVIVNRSLDTISYAGQVMGFSSALTKFVANNYTIIILSNNGTSYFERNQMTNEIAAALIDKKQQTQQIPLAFLLAQSFMDNNTHEVIKQYRLTPHQYSINEFRINALAEQLIWSGAKQKALLVLELNAELFPNSKNIARLIQQAK